MTVQSPFKMIGKLQIKHLSVIMFGLTGLTGTNKQDTQAHAGLTLDTSGGDMWNGGDM